MIKLLAVDMDGTLLDDDKKYDTKRFLRQLQELNRRGIHFVAASGNQYATIVRYMRDSAAEISFVAENGALVYTDGDLIFSAPITPEILQQTIPKLPSSRKVTTIFCGIESAYHLESMPSEQIDAIKMYYGKLSPVKNFTEIDDSILKIALAMPPPQTTPFSTEFNKQMKGNLRAVESGFGYVDVLPQNVNKATALRHLLEIFQVGEEETATFGDSYNDLEMLRMSPFSFAVQNAVPDALDAARYRIGNNNEGAVLNAIDDILAEKYGEIGNG